MVSGHTKKVVTNAVLFLGYCTGNIAGPFFYKTDQSYVRTRCSNLVKISNAIRLGLPMRLESGP